MRCIILSVFYRTGDRDVGLRLTIGGGRTLANFSVQPARAAFVAKACQPIDPGFLYSRRQARTVSSSSSRTLATAA